MGRNMAFRLVLRETLAGAMAEIHQLPLHPPENENIDI